MGSMMRARAVKQRIQGVAVYGLLLGLCIGLPLEAVAAAVSITAPLFLLVMVFQRQIVSGLTAGAVKG